MDTTERRPQGALGHAGPLASPSPSPVVKLRPQHETTPTSFSGHALNPGFRVFFPPPSPSRPAAAHARSDGVSAAGPGGQGREGSGGGGGRGRSPGSPLRTITRAGLGGATPQREVRAGLPGPVRRARAAGQAGPAQPGAGRRPWLGRTLRRGGPRRPAGGRSPRAGTRPCILRDGGPRERPNGTSTFRKPLQFLLFVTRSCVAQAGLRGVSHNAELQSECENSFYA